MSAGEKLKRIFWIGDTLRTLREFPEEVKDGFGYALYAAQRGEKPLKAKPLKGFGGASVIEVIEDLDGDTYRAVYTVRFTHAIYVLNVFKKKSKSGISTPKGEIDLVRDRLRAAEIHHRKNQGAWNES